MFRFSVVEARDLASKPVSVITLGPMNMGRILSILGGSLAFLIVLTGCDTREVAVAKKLPVSRTITDTSGRSIQVEVVGKDHESVTFIRSSDQKQYTIPLSRLSEADLKFLKKFPDVAVEPVPEPEPPYIASRKKEIANLERKRDQLYIESRSSSLPETVRKRKSKESQKLSDEIQGLYDAIRAYKSR